MRTLLVTSLLALGVLAAGCGSSPSSSGNTNTNSSSGEASKSAGAVLTDAVKAADAATSLHMSGQVNTSGQQIGIDLSIVTGKGATGSMTLKGAKVDLIVVGGKGYLKGGPDFWKKFGGSSGTAIATLLNGKWLEFPVNNAEFGPITGFANAKTIFDNLKTSAGKLTNEGATTYKGQNVVAINGGSANGTLYVANSGTPYPVALVKAGGASGGAITFDSWNASVTLTAPAGVLDFSKLGSGG